MKHTIIIGGHPSCGCGSFCSIPCMKEYHKEDKHNINGIILGNLK
jgi:hypothetical protein